MECVGRQATYRTRIATAALLLAAAWLVLLTGTHSAWAAEESAAVQVDVAAHVQTDGSLQVSELRTLEVSDDDTRVTWEFANISSDAELWVTSVHVAAVDETGAVVGDWASLPETTFMVGWREDGAPDGDAWAYDKLRGVLYAFFENITGRVTFKIDYTVENAATAYADVADLNWRWLPNYTEEAIESARLTVTLPVAPGVSVEPGENVRAWGHGPSGGTLTVGEDGSIAYEVPTVAAGRYAEAHIVFPSAWLSNLSGEVARAHLTQSHLDTVMANEVDWLDTGSAWERGESTLLAACLLLCAVVLIVGVALYWRFGKEYVPDYTDAYWCEAPDPALGAAVIGRLWRWNREKIDDLAAAALQMACAGILRIAPADEAEGGYCLERVDGDKAKNADAAVSCGSVNDAVKNDAVVAAALGALFAAAPGDGQRVSLADIRRFGAENPQELNRVVSAFQRALSARIDELGFFEPQGKRLQTIMLVVAAVFLVAAIGALASGALLVAAAFAATAVGVGLLANYMPRRTVRGNNVAARAKALRNWLRDAAFVGDSAAEAQAAAIVAFSEKHFSAEQCAQLLVYAHVLDVYTEPSAAALQAALAETATGVHTALSSVESSYDK